MKADFRLVFIGIACVFLTGCLFKPVKVSTRHFALSPISTNEPEPVPASGEHLRVGIGFVRLPSYLLRDSMAIRSSPNEIEYLENANWAERLDQCFQQTLVENISRLSPSNTVWLADSGQGRMNITVFVNVQQFDVDTQGRGRLIAQWRITVPDSDAPLKSGEARLERVGSSPHGKPEVIAFTMSALVAELSRELAESIREAASRKP